MESIISIPGEVKSALWAHLMPERFVVEQAAFLFAHAEVFGNRATFHYRDWYPIPAGGFEAQSAFYLELRTEEKARAIKRAHDLEASLIEFHSHVDTDFSDFSASDLSGFEEFVPHVWWRLRGRPYAAVVVTRSGFSGLAWIKSAEEPKELDGIVVDTKFFKSTRHFSVKTSGYGKAAF